MLIIYIVLVFSAYGIILLCDCNEYKYVGLDNCRKFGLQPPKEAFKKAVNQLQPTTSSSAGHK